MMVTNIAEGNCCKDINHHEWMTTTHPQHEGALAPQNGIENPKLQRREDYNRKKKNASDAQRQRFKRNSTSSTTKTWKSKYEHVKRKSMGAISEMHPQLGFETLATSSFALNALAKFANINLPEKLYREVEGIILLMVNLSQQATAVGVISSVLVWAQGRTSKSIYGTLKDFIEKLLVDKQDDTDPGWLTCLREMRCNWRLVKNNRSFHQISKLMGCLVTLGLCEASDLTWSVGQFRLIWPDLSERHLSAFDVSDALFETVIYFAEGGYLCWKTGSIRPLLINDRTAMELDAEYAQVMAWFDLVKNGNLAKFSSLTDQEFEKKLNDLSTSLLNLSLSLRGVEKKLVMDKYQKILQVQNDFIAMKIASGVRHAPWAVELFGESSQGKTTLGDQLVDALLISQGMPSDKRYRCAYNAADKFMSNWTSEKLVMIFDDMANDKSTFVEKPPTRAIIDVCNNQMYYAPKAELEAKGRCFVEPWIAVATTNKKDLDAGLYSNCPYSIQRRLVCITVKAKPEFQRFEGDIPCGIDAGKVRAHYTDEFGDYHPPMFDDIWTVTIERAVKPQNLKTVATYAPIEWKNKKMVDVSMGECIQWAIEDFDAHVQNQKAMLDAMKERENRMIRCHHPGCKHLAGNCPYHTPEEENEIEVFQDAQQMQFGRETVKSLHQLWYGTTPICRGIDTIYDRIDADAADIIYRRGSEFLKRWDWITIVPSQVFKLDCAPDIFKYLYQDRLTKRYDLETKRLRVTLAASLLLAFCIGGTFGCVIAVFAVCKFLCVLAAFRERVEDDFYEELKAKNMEIAPMLRKYRDEYANDICIAFVSIAALYGLARAYRAYRQAQQDSHGSLEPLTEEEIAQRDSETNVWTTVVQRELPLTEISQRMSCEQLQNVVEKALVYGTIHNSDTNGRVNGLMLSSNVMLVPNHYFSEFGDELSCTFRRKNPESSGGKFVAKLHIDATHLIPGTDLRVCYVPNGGSYKNLVNFFPTSEMPKTPFRMLWRKKDGEMIIAKGLTKPGVVKTVHEFPGGMYSNLTMNTFGGLCGATLISETNGSAIIGIHLGGTDGTPIGCYGSITQTQLLNAYTDLRTKEGVILSGEAGKFEAQVLGVQILKDDPLHKKSALNYMPENSQVEYLGSCAGRAIMKSDVKVTPISEHVMEVCGVPNIYRGPKLNPDWHAWQECLSNLSIPATPYTYSLLEVAVRDYKEPLLKVFARPMWRCTRPLDDVENLCGVKGKKFLDAIKLDTSIGFPLSGPKRAFVTELEPTEEVPNLREFDPVLMEEIARIEDCYRRGERAYPIAKACKKDEIHSKDKCRIFYGNALSLTWLIRKYYLPILRVLQFNPLLSECAVGINSHGPEWEQLHQFVVKHGLDRLFGGDYGKYDQKLPSQLIFAALRIMIDFARVCDYSEEDLRVMEAMTGDIVFAYIAFNGDLIGLTEGTHISGNSLTVIINGICGSLNLRCAFYNAYPCLSYEDRLPFREYVNAMTYGDDNIGSIHPSIDKFNIKTISEFLGEYGQIYTMPDKESELIPFLPPEEFEFLKRKSVYHPQLGKHVGALVDKSIYKSLHCYIRGKNSPITELEACAQNIDGALREWFNHGKDKYEMQRGLMKEVASRADIAHMCTGLDTTYEERVETWFAQYEPT
nr:MAG: putative nonstructural protein [Salisharnavirus sp.]